VVSGRLDSNSDVEIEQGEDEHPCRCKTYMDGWMDGLFQEGGFCNLVWVHFIISQGAPRPHCTWELSYPTARGGRFTHRSVTKCSRRRIHSSRPKRLYRFYTGCIPQGAPSAQEYRPTPKPHPRGIRGADSDHHKTGTYGRYSYRSALGSDSKTTAMDFVTPFGLCVLTPSCEYGLLHYSQRLPAATCAGETRAT
jgi:hypothetical protein